MPRTSKATKVEKSEIVPKKADTPLSEETPGDVRDNAPEPRTERKSAKTTTKTTTTLEDVRKYLEDSR